MAHAGHPFLFFPLPKRFKQTVMAITQYRFRMNQQHVLSSARSTFSSAFILLLLLSAGFAAEANAYDAARDRQAEPLFRFALQKQTGEEFQRGDAVDIQPDWQLLATSLSEGAELVVPSLPGNDDRYRITAVREFLDGIVSVSAVHNSSPYDHLSFSYDASNGLLLGSIHQHTLGRGFRIAPPPESYRKATPGAGGFHVLEYRDPESEDVLSCGVDHQLTESAAYQKQYYDPYSQSHVHSPFDIQSSGAAGPVPIDLLIVYTEAAETWAGQNEGNIQLLIAEMMNISQRAMDNSEANIEFRVVHTHKTAYEETGNDSETDLRRLTTSTSFNPWGSEYQGYMEDVHTLRNQYGADLVSLLVTNSDVGGLAFLLNNAAGIPQLGFSLNRVQQMTSTTTFVHEIGHNLGNAHSRNQRRNAADVYGGLFDYSTGWRFTGNSGTPYVTVMAYREAPDQSLGTAIEYFSNPEVSFDGRSTGSYSGGNAPADNVRSMLYTRNVVASYRPTQVDPPSASLDNSLIQIDANYGEKQEIQVTLSNNGNSPLHWTTDISYPEPSVPAKIALSGSAGIALEGPERPVIGTAYPYFNTKGSRLIRHDDSPVYSYAPAAASAHDSYGKNGLTGNGSILAGNGNADVPGNVVYHTDFDLAFLSGDSAYFQALEGWSAWPRSENNQFILTKENPRSSLQNLRLEPRPDLDPGRLTGVTAPFFGPLTSQGYSLSMDLQLPEMGTQNQFHILVEESSRDNLTAWVWFDNGKIIIRNRITPEGNDFYDFGIFYPVDEYFNFEIRTDPLNKRILYFVDGEQVLNGNLYGGSAPERVLLAHANYPTEEVFDIDNFHISSLRTRDFPRFQHRKQSGGIDAGSSGQITFDVYADRPHDGIYEFDLVVNTNDAANPRFSIPVRYEVSSAPTISKGETVAGEFRLNQNYPNPFNPSTTITYIIPEQSDVRLDVINISGQRVATLVDENRHAGEHSVTFDAGGLASGVYLYRLQAGPFTKTARMVLVK
jgi:hypothetical protein